MRAIFSIDSTDAQVAALDSADHGDESSICVRELALVHVPRLAVMAHVRFNDCLKVTAHLRREPDQRYFRASDCR